MAIHDEYREIALWGMINMTPALTGYIDKTHRPLIDGGYYTKTTGNRPLIGPLPVSGTYIIGSLSGYGLVVACAAGELLAAQIAGSNCPNMRMHSSPSDTKILTTRTSYLLGM